MQVVIDGVTFVPVPQLNDIARLPAALEVRFDSDAGKDLSVREYLAALLLGVWKEGEGFDGKRPFGNSGWHYELCKPLVRAGFIKGKLDADGYIEDVEDGAKAFVTSLIHAMCGTTPKAGAR